MQVPKAVRHWSVPGRACCAQLFLHAEKAVCAVATQVGSLLQAFSAGARVALHACTQDRSAACTGFSHVARSFSQAVAHATPASGAKQLAYAVSNSDLHVADAVVGRQALRAVIACLMQAVVAALNEAWAGPPSRTIPVASPAARTTGICLIIIPPLIFLPPICSSSICSKRGADEQEASFP